MRNKQDITVLNFSSAVGILTAEDTEENENSQWANAERCFYTIHGHKLCKTDSSPP